MPAGMFLWFRTYFEEVFVSKEGFSNSIMINKTNAIRHQPLKFLNLLFEILDSFNIILVTLFTDKSSNWIIPCSILSWLSRFYFRLHLIIINKKVINQKEKN